MLKLGKVLRLIALAILSGGSAAIVFAAITLVKVAVADGIPTAEAAARNAPLFIYYSKVVLGGAVLLGLGEFFELSQRKEPSVETFRKFALFASIVCIVCVGIFAFGIVPPMEKLLPDLRTVKETHEQFQHLHKMSEGVFGASILLAFASLVLPVFSKQATPVSSTQTESKVLL